MTNGGGGGNYKDLAKSNKLYTFIFFFALFGVFMLFFGYGYPSLPFWGDDWQYLSTYGTMKPGDNGWIPARILPQLLHTALGVACAYVAMPLSGLDFVEAMVYTSAFVLSTSTLALCYAIYRLLLAITQQQILALFATSGFVIIGFCASKTTSMPLFLPADLQAEGMGYTITLIAFYIVPNLLNLGLLCALMWYQISSVPSDNAHSLPLDLSLNKHAKHSFLLGILVALLYLSQFSMTSSALILSTYCGAALLVRVVGFARGGSGVTRLMQSFGLYEVLLVACVMLFMVALIYDLGGGRGKACGGFDFFFGLKYSLDSVRTLRALFRIGLILLLGIMLYLWITHKPLRTLLATHFIWLATLGLGYMVIVSSCGAKYYLMSGLLLSMGLIACVWLGIALAYIPKLIAPAVFAVVFGLLHPFQGYTERPRDSYLVHKSYADSWVAQVREAESSGLESVTIFVPKELPHWQWKGWFFPWFAHTLRQFGIIRREMKVEFKPIE